MARIKYQEAAGLLVKCGRPLNGRTPTRDELVRLYIREGESIRAVAENLGCSKDTVSRALKTYRIEARTNIKRSGLRKHDLEALQAAAKKGGVRGTAKELGVSPSTLSRFLKLRKEK